MITRDGTQGFFFYPKALQSNVTQWEGRVVAKKYLGYLPSKRMGSSLCSYKTNSKVEIPVGGVWRD